MRLLLRIIVRLRGRGRGRPRHDMAGADARHRVRRDSDRRLDRLAEDRHAGRRPLLRARRSPAAANCRSAPATASPFSPAPTTTARRSTAAATCVINGITPQARFWTITLYDRRAGWSPIRSTAMASPARRSCATPTAASRSPWRRARAPATGCRPAASSSYRAGAAALRHAGRRRDARGARSADAGDHSSEESAHDPLAAVAARRRAARRHRASGRRC